MDEIKIDANIGVDNMILLVVDTQKGCFNENLYLFETIKKNIKQLITLARENNVEVVYVQHDDGPGTDLDKFADNYEIYEEFAPRDGEKRFEKNVNSAFHPMTGLAEYLQSIGEKDIIAIGVSTDYCMDATVKSGFERGFNIIIPEYTNSTYDNPYFDKEAAYHYFNDFMWNNRYAKVISFEQVTELLQSKDNKKNPWEEISLETYEKHMSLDSVKQLQLMNRIMKSQFEDYPVDTVMILGIAGGNGLEHIDIKKYKKVYGVDINELYLQETQKRYSNLADILQCLHLDIVCETEKLPQSQLLVANLLIEYIGYDAFVRAVNIINPEYISCVIQINTDEEMWVSDSPYIHAFDGLDEIHHQMESDVLNEKMNSIGFKLILQDMTELPNSKALVRLDYQKKI
ncbi:Nicotinamidase-related amidase [Eubacterium ruminantium]|nr:Nicotinamidase-related amidase [Eubacterium ruminantium]